MLGLSDPWRLVGLNSVQHYVQGIINGLVVPGSTGKIEAWIQPPALEPLDGPKAYVWGGKMRKRRQTVPRGRGFQQLDWIVDIFLAYETVSDTTNDSTVDQEFPLIVDAVMDALAATPMPLFITDPTTGKQTQVTSIGEELDLEYPQEKAPATDRLLYYVCVIGAHVTEVVQT